MSSTCFAKTEFRTETSALPFQLLLGILDKATLTLGDNSRVDLSQTVVFLTSNLGGAQIADLMQGGMGFVQPADKPTQGLDETLQRKELDEGLEIELGQVQERVLDCTPRPFWFRMTDSSREFLLKEGTDQRYGARHLKRAIERYLVSPLARLLGTEQLRAGDFLLIDRHPAERGLAFLKDEEEQHAFHAQTHFAPSIPMELAIAQAGVSF